MGIGEPATLFRQPIDVECLHLRRAITSQVAIAEIIGKYEYDVGLLSSGKWQGQPKANGTNEGQEFHFSFFRCFSLYRLSGGAHPHWNIRRFLMLIDDCVRSHVDPRLAGYHVRRRKNFSTPSNLISLKAPIT